MLKKQGFPLSYSTVVLEMKRIKSSGNECFIRQDYDLGDRLAYKAHILDLSRNVSHRYEETVSWKNRKK